jgi:hypothetical protein
LPDGTVLDVVALARETCRRYRAEFPDEEERYGDAGLAWCVHDNQHILAWAAHSLSGWVDLERELTWLAGVLEAREFPLARLARDLELAAEVVGEAAPDRHADLARALEDGAALVRSRSTFLDG